MIFTLFFLLYFIHTVSPRVNAPCGLWLKLRNFADGSCNCSSGHHYHSKCAGATTLAVPMLTYCPYIHGFFRVLRVRLLEYLQYTSFFFLQVYESGREFLLSVCWLFLTGTSIFCLNVSYLLWLLEILTFWNWAFIHILACRSLKMPAISTTVCPISLVGIELPYVHSSMRTHP